ncbi:MAG: hypothetical protein COA93_00820 [Alphaproteobacteria bacterium]|nr:MAG: hypothetical protein COA93_00820 [Alphaproteobacteria bacterium]
MRPKIKLFAIDIKTGRKDFRPVFYYYIQPEGLCVFLYYTIVVISAKERCLILWSEREFDMNFRMGNAG